MKDFELKKALVEEIEALKEVQKATENLVRQAQQKISEAEVMLNASNKVNSYLEIEIERKRAVLKEIRESEQNEQT